jgi:branched-chain amino acid transport system permease protein
MAFPSLLFWVQSADPVLMALAGGVRSFFGLVVGAALFVFLKFMVSTYADYPLFVFGIVVLLVVLFLPEGIVGTAAKLWPRRRHAVRAGTRMSTAALPAERRTEAP